MIENQVITDPMEKTPQDLHLKSWTNDEEISEEE